MQYELGSKLTCVAFCGIIIVPNSLLIVLITTIPAGPKKKNANTVFNIHSPQVYTFDSNNIIHSTGSCIRDLGFSGKGGFCNVEKHA
jgi:hypothetical protein